MVDKNNAGNKESQLSYETVSAGNGQEALEKVQTESPDLVLLNIMMPVLDGFAVLAHLKSDPKLRYIPVSVIPAMNDLQSVVKMSNEAKITFW